jgi:hypothetical protein
MFSSELEDSDRLVNVVLGRLSKELDGFSWMLEKKTGLFLDIGLNDFVGFSAFRKKEKLIDTGFFCLVLSGSWISNLLDGLAFLDIDDCLINQLLTQKYRLANSPAIADLPFFDFMVITEQLVNKLQRVSLNTYR